MDSIPQFLIAAPTSGSGKTTVSRGLMALFVKKGLKVQPFKCGPDYIDTKYHEAVCGRPSINLDTFMASPEHVRSLYARYSADADVAVVEGMMGMYDGYDRDRGSSAEVARLLGIPVVLVVDAKSAAYSMAPLLSGFINFRPDIRIAGVIFNRVGSPHHYRMLQEVCEDLKVTCLGYLPKRKPVTLRNRTIRSAAFESMGKDFGPTRQLKDYHVAVARGGVGMTTLAYAAVCRSGLSFNKQLWLRPEIVPGLREITDAVHREGAAAAIQIGHCGNMTHWTTAGQMPIGASTGFNLYAYTPVRGMKRREIEQVARDFGTAVRTARDAGFDSVEVHAGHGYLISQFLSPYTNHRHDEYGGSLENRMRFMRMCLGEAVEAARACGMAITVKHNMYDGFKGGIEIPESIEIAKVIESFGVDGIVLSGGFVSKAPMAVMRGLIPIYTMSYYSPLWLRYFIRWCGPFMIKQFPFEECYFLEDAKKFRAALKGPLIYVGGLVSREGIDRALDSGFELVQMARALVNDPAFVAKLREGDAATRSACDHRNYCIARMYSVDMKCCKHCDNLPRRIVEELKRLP